MVTTFNTKDMTAFGNYLLNLVSTGVKAPGPDGLIQVTHADFCNWKDSMSSVKKVRAKMVCVSVKPDHESSSVELQAVIDGSEENESFSKYTPAASLHIEIDNQSDAFQLFDKDREYYIDITKAPVE